MNELNDLLTASSPLLIAIFATVYGKILDLSPVPNKLIPFILPITGAVAYMGLEGWNYRNGILGFVIAGMAAVGANQIWRKFINYGADEIKTLKEENETLKAHLRELANKVNIKP